MPTANLKKSRKYSDLNMLFGTHPVTKDVLVRIDEDAIKNSIKHLLLTKNYERLFHPEIGCQASSLLFELFTPVTAEIIKKTVKNALKNFEPRISVIDVRVAEDEDNYSISISIDFRILNIENSQLLTVTTYLERIR